MGLRSGSSSDLNSACFEVLVQVRIFQFENMLNKTDDIGALSPGGYKHINVFFELLKLEVGNLKFL